MAGVSVRLKLAVAAASVCLAIFPLAAQEPTASRTPRGTSEQGLLAEVLVTARRREENLQSVPAAISRVMGVTMRVKF
jgi:outer membrane receptor protein involved in Fe transport